MKANEINQVGTAKLALVDQGIPNLVRGAAQESHQQFPKAGQRNTVEVERFLRGRTPLNLCLTVRAFTDFANDAEFAYPVQSQIITSVRQGREKRDSPGAAYLENVRIGMIVALPIPLKGRHPDNPMTRRDVGDHFAVTRLEDMQRDRDPREKHKVRQRENWYNFG